MRACRNLAVGLCSLTAFVGLGSTVAGGASIHAETFSSGAAGWSSSSGSLLVAGDGQTLRGQFSAQEFPFPESGSFLATDASSDGAFVGDYDAAGVRLLGFSFMAQDKVPSAAALRWSGPTSSFFRSFAAYVVQTGVWYRLAFSLAGKDAGKWVGGTAEAFDQALMDVRGLEIQLTRTGMAVQRYYIDDVFLDSLPVGRPDVAAGVQVVWSSLRSNVAYVVESAETASGPWDSLDSFVATGQSHLWLDETATNVPRRAYRLMFNESQAGR